MNSTTAETLVSNASDLPKPAYVSPVLTSLGDVRDVTLGGSPGSGDSGAPATQRF
jgi:hypothetical protein